MAKRYDIWVDYDILVVEECEDGDWVKHNDHAAELTTLRADLAAMTQQDNGGAAFPSLYAIGDIAYSQGGMNLRDWFAGQALAGLLSNPAHDGMPCNHWASDAYSMADAMLAARNTNAD